MILDLLAPRHPGAAAAARHLSAFERLREAVRRPPAPNRYIAPWLRSVDAVLFALRGYHVFWTAPIARRMFDISTGAVADRHVTPSILVYESRYLTVDSASSFLELPTVIPRQLTMLVHRFAKHPTPEKS